MTSQDHYSFSPSGFKQAWTWFINCYQYSLRDFVFKRKLVLKKASVDTYYYVQRGRRRYFLLQVSKNHVLSYVRIGLTQAKENGIEVNQALTLFTDLSVRFPLRHYLKWFLVVSPMFTAVIVVLGVTFFMAYLKTTWVEQIESGNWLASSYCGVNCSKDFAQVVILSLYGLLASLIGLFWSPFHYLLTYRIHKYTKVRRSTFLEVLVVFSLSLFSAAVNFDSRKIHKLYQLVIAYHDGEVGKLESTQQASRLKNKQKKKNP